MYNISSKFKNYSFTKIKGGASKKIFYRLKKSDRSYILTDFNCNKTEYFNHLKVYKILKDLDISIPKIFESNDKDLTIIAQDFGDLRYDKIINKEPIDNLLRYAVDSLITINQCITLNNNDNLSIYSFQDFKKEIMELPKYYFPYLNGEINNSLSEEYLFIWSECFDNFDFNFSSFVHKDFNINNLILIPSNKNHLKCGIIDYQGAFWGESCWDLFSLLEDSRIYFTDEFNDKLISYFFLETKEKISITDYKMKYHFLNCSRQSRLLGRWIKLFKDFDKEWYLDFIPITKKRLLKSLKFLNNKKLKEFYNQHIFDHEF